MTDEQPRTYVTMAGKSIGKCSSGHWLPLKGNCDLCGAGPDEKCRYSQPAPLPADQQK
jgi:hypothetical protein